MRRGKKEGSRHRELGDEVLGAYLCCWVLTCWGKQG